MPPQHDYFQDRAFVFFSFCFSGLLSLFVCLHWVTIKFFSWEKEFLLSSALCSLSPLEKFKVLFSPKWTLELGLVAL